MGAMLLISDIDASFTEIFVSLEADYRSSYLLEWGICPQEYIRLTREKQHRIIVSTYNV